MLEEFDGGGGEEVYGVGVAQGHGEVAEDLFLAAFDIVEEALEFAGAFDVDVLLADAGVEAPRELVAGVDGDDVLDFEVVQGHEELGSERAVVDVAGAEEESAQELEDHVVEFDVAADHVRQFLDDFAWNSNI